jgi:hypothetical protein
MTKTLETIKQEALERLAQDFTHRTDGKRPQLHPDSLWNVKLVYLLSLALDRAVAATLEEAVEAFDQDTCDQCGAYLKPQVRAALRSLTTND